MLYTRQNIAVNDNASVHECIAGEFKAELGKHGVALGVCGQTKAGDGGEAEVVPPVVEDDESGFGCVAAAVVRREDTVTQILRRCVQ